MTPSLDITQRKPVWMALSEFYLDTELEDADFRSIAAVVLKSPYSLEEVKAINRYEVFPALQPNLFGTAGVWSGFEETFVVEKIMAHLEKPSVWNKISFKMSEWMHKSSWQKLENAYNELKNIT